MPKEIRRINLLQTLILTTHTVLKYRDHRPIHVTEMFVLGYT